jgi:hypothetical protein
LPRAEEVGMSKNVEIIGLAGGASVDSHDGRGNTTTGIKITCTAATSIKLEELTPLQGDLKELTHRNFEKLKKSILKHGISFPFFVWQDNGINYVLDGHQRDRVLRKMQKQGYEDLNEHDRLRHDVVMGLLTEKQDPTIRQF